MSEQITLTSVLDRIENFQNDVNKQFRTVGEDIAVHNEKLERILGNGQPGELEKLEVEIRKRPARTEIQPFITMAQKHEKWYNNITGAWWLVVKVGAVVAFIVG